MDHPPLIGITTHSLHDPNREALDRLCAGAVDAVAAAGALPVLVPHGLAEATLLALAARFDGLLITGGGDVAAACYGGAGHPGIAGVDDWRDRAEIALARLAVQRCLPFLAICRGMQVLNVALGGTLHPELADLPGMLRHDSDPALPYDRVAHTVEVRAGTRLATLVGATVVPVNSLHHQAIDRLAPSLEVTAVAPDGLVEAVEVAAHGFGLAVQWHPEAMPQEASARALFEGLVAASRGAATRVAAGVAPGAVDGADAGAGSGTGIRRAEGAASPTGAPSATQAT